MQVEVEAREDAPQGGDGDEAVSDAGLGGSGDTRLRGQGRRGGSAPRFHPSCFHFQAKTRNLPRSEPRFLPFASAEPVSHGGGGTNKESRGV